MNIYFKYQQRGDLVLKGYIMGNHFEFQSYYRHAHIHFTDVNKSYILKESELEHFCSFMSVRQAKWLICKGYIYLLISKLYTK